MRRFPLLRLATLIVGLGAALPPAVGLARTLERVAVVADVSVDGEPADAAATDAFQALLTDPLVTAGVRMVDPEAAKRVRAFVAAPAALEGRLPAGVSTLDADWVLAARAECRTREERGVMERVRTRTGAGTVLISTNCTATVSLISTDTAEIAGRHSLAGAGAAAYAHEAVRRALERVAGELGRRHLGGLLERARAERPVQIWLFAPPDRRAAERLREVLASVDGAVEASLVSFDETVARLEAGHAGGGLGLAKVLEGRDDLEVRVERATRSLLTLRWDPSAALTTRIHVRPLRDATGDARLATRAAVTSGRLAALLTGSGYLVPVETPDGADLVVSGEVRRNRKGALEVAVTVARGGATLTRARSAAADPEAELAEALTASIPQALARKARTRRTDAFAARFSEAPDRLSRARASRRLVVTASEVKDLFPARLAAAGEAVLGHVDLRAANPAGALPVGRGALEIVARAEVVGLSAGPRLSAPVTLDADGSARIPLVVTLDSERLLARRVASGGQVRVELMWREDGAERSDTFVVPVRIHERNAIDWREGETAAAFVTPRDPAVRGMVERALAGAPVATAALPPAVVRAVRVIEILRARGLTYAPDPVVPFGSSDLDVVRYPGETLVSGQGDCSDLSVLLAAALEAAGVRTFLVTTPGHVLVAYDTGLPPLLARGLGADLDSGGRALVAVEATALDRGYAAAVAAGAEAVAHRPAAVGLIAVRDAWRRTPPAPFELGTAAVPQVPAPATDGVLTALVQARAEALAAAVAGAEARVATAPADPSLRLSLAQVLMGEGRGADALRTLRDSPAPGDDAAWWCTEANLLAVTGDLDAAAAALAAALARPAVAGDPALASTFGRNLAVIRLVGGDEPGAVTALAAALEADADTLSDLGLEGLALSRASDTDGAERVLDGDLGRLLAEARRKLSERARAAPEDTDERDDAPQIISGGRRGNDPEARRALAAVLAWLEPPGGATGSPR